MERKTELPIIIHVINSLERGGAETLLINLLPELNQYYRIVLVTLLPDIDFEEEQIVCYHRYCIHYTGPSSTLNCALRLRHLIKEYKPILVRAQLFLSSLIARIATPKLTPMIFSIHSTMSRDCYTKNKLSLPIEKITYNKHHHLIGVSNDVLKDFDEYVGIKGATYTLYNYINPRYYEHILPRKVSKPTSLRLVAVGNIKEVKNYGYLIEAFKKLKSVDISLDIYGDGPLRDSLQKEILEHRLPIRLMGVRSDIYNVLQDYDLYVMPSLYEGFGIAPVEAMATGLPLLLSDLTVLREVTQNNALFFDPKKPDDFVELISKIFSGGADLNTLSDTGIRISQENYQQGLYIKKLIDIYNKVASKI